MVCYEDDNERRFTLFTVAATMTKPQPEEENYCTYTSVKIDDEVARRVRGAAGVAGESVQDWVSDVLNDAAAKILGLKKIQRRKVRRPKTGD